MDPQKEKILASRIQLRLHCANMLECAVCYCKIMIHIDQCRLQTPRGDALNIERKYN